MGNGGRKKKKRRCCDLAITLTVGLIPGQCPPVLSMNTCAPFQFFQMVKDRVLLNMLL